MEYRDNPQLIGFVDELVKWNRAYNLIGRNSVDEIWENHVKDSLELLPHVEKDPAPVVVDIGSGGGFPAIPLSILLPGKRFILTDVIAKKLAFLEYAVKKFGLNAAVINPEPAWRCEESCLVISRAYAEISRIVEWASVHAPAARGFLILKGREDNARLEMEKADIKDYEIITLEKGCIVGFGRR